MVRVFVAGGSGGGASNGSGRMSTTFTYGTVRISDIKVETRPHPTKAGRKEVDHLLINDEPIKPTDRFWTSIATRFSAFGVNSQLFNLYDHDEVFNRLTERATSDLLRFTIERTPNRDPRILAVISPEKPTITYEALMNVLSAYTSDQVRYHEGIVTSVHSPTVGSSAYKVPCPYDRGPTHEFRNRYMMEVAIDGYGKPVVYPGLERVDDGATLITKGTKTFKQELNVGKGADVVHHALTRALESYNTDEGFAALRNRMQYGRRSWASVYESQAAYKLLVKMISTGRITGVSDGESVDTSQALNDFHTLTGDMSEIYGAADMDSLIAKKQRNLPVACTIYDLICFLAGLATYNSANMGHSDLYSLIGSFLGEGSYDLEKSRDKWKSFKDFTINLHRDASNRLVSVEE